jgi:hypothetical protein
MDTFNERDNRLANHRDPRTDGELWHLSQSEWDARARGELRAMADELVSSDDFGPFEEARLARAADYYRRAGDSQAAERIEIEILERFPRSFSAQRIRERSDKTPPTLAVTAPDWLWPPNHKLVPITVAVQVSDDRDPNPTVKLESITCDDGCDPTKDVADAMVNTDDRQFQLRASAAAPGLAGRTRSRARPGESSTRCAEARTRELDASAVYSESTRVDARTAPPTLVRSGRGRHRPGTAPASA